MAQNRNQGQQTQGQVDPAEGARGDQERGRGSNKGERNRSDEASSSRSSNRSGGGISNRGMDREMSEQEGLPERGSSDSSDSER